MLERKAGAGDPSSRWLGLCWHAAPAPTRFVREALCRNGNAVASKLEDATGRLRQPGAHTAMLESSVCYRAWS